ncbi:MAG: ATP phosphoribosyltransferase regulatory subunit [Eubacterium sp.]|nr:ATP phosphoribosyltransferase regulatory subunit [Eubacterium sp.]
MLENYTIDGFENIQYQGYHALRKIEDSLSRLFTLYGYQPISTPTFESYDLYAAENSIPSDDLFKLVDHRGRVLALKPDATLPVTRMAAINHQDPETTVKLFYRTNIYRNFGASEMVKKELTQMGIEYFGSRSPECDGEIIALAIESLITSGIDDVQIDLGHVGFINHLLEELSLSELQKNQLFRFIEHKNIGDIDDFIARNDIEPRIAKILRRLPKLYGDPADVFARMETLCVNPKMEAVVTELKAIYDHLKAIGCGSRISFDLGFTNQMNYYSGIIFKGYIGGWGQSVLSGGRYDHLSAKFGIDRPACGFGLDLLTMMDYLEQRRLLPEADNARAVLLYAASVKAEAYALGKRLRGAGIPTELFVLREDAHTQATRLKKNALYKNARFYLVDDSGQFCLTAGDKIPTDSIFTKEVH